MWNFIAVMAIIWGAVSNMGLCGGFIRFKPLPTYASWKDLPPRWINFFASHIAMTIGVAYFVIRYFSR